MRAQPVILTPDPVLAKQAVSFLAGRFGCLASVATDHESALDLLARIAAPTVLLDARPGPAVAEAAALLNRVLDGRLPALNVVTVRGDVLPVECAEQADMLGLVELPPEGDWAADEDRLAALQRILDSPRAHPVPRRFEAGGSELMIWTYTPAMFPVLENVLRVSHHDVTLLIVGETGTGKTTMAKFIHVNSPRRDRPFQTLACGALPADLIESELFGHARGAFTGADRNKMGRFQAAGRGTLLLDEIDVLDPKQQSKLLRVIETGEFEMVGSTETKMSEARLIVASNVDLESLTESARFRADLYYRLNVLEFPLMPLRERPLDVVPLAMSFVREFCSQHAVAIRGIHRSFIEAVRRYPWPGNIRELKNHVRRAVLLCEQSDLAAGDLSPNITRAQFTESGSETAGPGRGWTLSDRVAQSEKEMLEEALRAHNDNRTATAKALGLSRVGLYKKLRRFGITKDPAPRGREGAGSR
jgi:DNA-binding NtrC family response regulator